MKILGLILLASTAVCAQAPPLTADSAAPIVHGKDVAAIPMAAYIENGKALIATDLGKAPKDAVVIQVEIFPLGGRASYHRVTIPKGKTFTAPKDGDALAYVVKGKLHVKLGAVEADVGPGDAWRKIAVQDNVYTAIDEAVILDTAAPAAAEATAPVVYAKNVSKSPIAFYMADGKNVVARGPDAAKAPKDAVVVQVEIMPLGGTQSYRRITIAKGQSFTAPTNSDTLVTVLKGRMKLKLGTVDAEVGEGDAWRKIAVQTNVYTALEDTLLLETDGPKT